jgi:hypothetical protein
MMMTWVTLEALLNCLYFLFGPFALLSDLGKVFLFALKRKSPGFPILSSPTMYGHCSVDGIELVPNRE